jgi:raffinose/stachyose/melibiose transport system permease protein
VGGLSVLPGGRRRREPSKIPYYIVLILLALFALGPLVVLVFNSLKTSAEIGRNPLGPPLSPVFQNFPDAWTQGNFSTTMVNSTILTLGTIIGVCVIAATSAYAMARLDLPGTDAILLYLWVTSAVPFQIFLVPLFFLWTNLQLTNTRFGLIVIYWAIFSPLATLLMRSYLIGLPRDFEDAAEVGAPLYIVAPTAYARVQPIGDPLDEWLWAVEGIRTAGEHASSLGVDLTLECWNRYGT